jgi:hypothetical protein
MQLYHIVIDVELEDDEEAARVLDQVKQALTPPPIPNREWAFAVLSADEMRRRPWGHPGH